MSVRARHALHDLSAACLWLQDQYLRERICGTHKALWAPCRQHPRMTWAECHLFTQPVPYTWTREMQHRVASHDPAAMMMMMEAGA